MKKRRLDPLARRRRGLARRARIVARRASRPDLRSAATLQAFVDTLGVPRTTLWSWEYLGIPTDRRSDYLAALEAVEVALEKAEEVSP